MGYTVQAKNLTLDYGNFKGLKEVSFTLEADKIYGLLGRNGAGKTSLLSLLASFQKQTLGSLIIGGEAPFENEKTMKNVAFLYEKNYEDESEKVKGMLEFVESYRPNFDKDYAMELIKRFNLPLDKAINKLSKGMQSALNAIIGLASRTKLTIFDEVYLSMDAPTREVFYQEVLADQERHPRTIILSTHLVSEMDYLFDEVLIIKKGELLLHEEFELLVSKGVSVTGAVNEVDHFVNGMEKLNEQQLGGTKSAMIYGTLSNVDRQRAKEAGLEIGPLSLQDLFIHITKEDA